MKFRYEFEYISLEVKDTLTVIKIQINELLKQWFI
jgi:hypothetical protein